MKNIFIVCLSVVVAVLSVYIYFKIEPDIPKPDEGVIFYYQCSNFSERRLFHLGKSIPLTQGQPLFVVIPGYTESTFRTWVKLMVQELLEAKPGSCVLLVDHWNLLIFSRPYMTQNVNTVAVDVARVLMDLQASVQLSLSSVHVMGFSLGAWVSGLISNHLPRGHTIGRITGMDASFPWMDTSDPKEFLDSADADVVVMLRTSRVSEKVPPIQFDFVVNGGEIQPGCDVWWHPDFIQQICSHQKAPLLVASSLRQERDAFDACLCPDRESLLNGTCSCHVKNSFGLNTITSLKGTFYLETLRTER